MTRLLNPARRGFHRFEICVCEHRLMTIRKLNVLSLLALGAAVLRGLAEFVALQRWRFLGRSPR